MRLETTKEVMNSALKMRNIFWAVSLSLILIMLIILNKYSLYVIFFIILTSNYDKTSSLIFIRSNQNNRFEMLKATRLVFKAIGTVNAISNIYETPALGFVGADFKLPWRFIRFIKLMTFY